MSNNPLIGGPGADPLELAKLFGIDINAPSPPNGSQAPPADTNAREQVDLTAYPSVQDALDNPVLRKDGSVDRSKTTYSVVAACGDAGLIKIEQMRWAVDQDPGLKARIVKFLARTPPKDDVWECRERWLSLNAWAAPQQPAAGAGPGSQAAPQQPAAGAGPQAAPQQPAVAPQQPSAPTVTVKAFRLPDGLQANDIGNAGRLIRLAGHKIRYVHAWGKWLVYTDGRWILDEKDALVTELAKGVSADLFQLAAKVAKRSKEKAKPVWAWALRSCTAGSVAAMIKLARGVPAVIVNHEQLDSDPWLLNVANGTIDLRTGKLRAHNPDDLCTIQAPAAYDPNATAPLWGKCLQTWQPDTEVLTYLQARAGAGATGIPTETVDIDYGEGGNGKSKFHGAIQHVLGPYATVPHKSLLVAGRFEQHPTVIAKLFRKRLAVASETNAAEALNEEQVKNLTGGDRLEGRRMREDPWEFFPSHTLVMFSNHKPAIRGRDEGVWRRLRLVPWEVTIKNPDGLLSTKLQAEAAGILRWIVDGAVRFNRDGLDPPAAVLAATAGYRQSEDVIGRFCDESLDFDPTVHCYSTDIKRELDNWCADQDIVSPRMNDVAAILRQRGAKDLGRRKNWAGRSTYWDGVCVS